MDKRKKPRTPPPPRPVQAPKERSGPAAGLRRERRTEPAQRQPGEPRQGGGSRLWLLGAGAAVVAVVVAVVLATTLGGGGDASALTDAGCVQETFPSQGRQHVEELEEGFEYNSFPPTSGPHDAQPAIWNIYEEPPGERHLLHSLEHGGIAIQYGADVPEATVDSIRAWYEQSDRKGIIVAPLPDLGDKVALTAWTKLATCPGFEPEAVDAFVELYRYKGPERLPLENMLPGAA